MNNKENISCFIGSHAASKSTINPKNLRPLHKVLVGFDSIDLEQSNGAVPHLHTGAGRSELTTPPLLDVP